MEKLLEITKDVSKGDIAIAHEPDAENVLLMGPSKAGKSTLLNHLIGVDLIADDHNLVLCYSLSGHTEKSLIIGADYASETSVPSKRE